MFSMLLAALIMTKAVPEGEIRLYDDVAVCDVVEGTDVYSHHAELVVDIPDLVVDPKIVDMGCWYAIEGEPYFTVIWDSGKTTRYHKEGTEKIAQPSELWKAGAAMAAILATISASDFEESKPVSP